jgi:hypothetical protein
VAHAKGERTIYLNRVDSYKNAGENQGVDHFSLDCMELIQLPHFGGSAQPAESFYLRKMSVTPFGVFDEAEQTGVVYLFSQRHGKTNSNHVASILDDVVNKKKKSGVNNRKLRVNFDNCSVNKCYLLCRFAVELIRSGRYDSVEFAFMVAGHTKFGPDRMFGWLSTVLKNVDIFEVTDIAMEVEKAQSIYLRERKVASPYSVTIIDGFDDKGQSKFFGDWKSYFGDSFRPFGFLSELHRLKFSKSATSIAIKAKEKSSDNTWKPVKFLKPVKKGKRILKKLKKVPMKKAKIADLKRMTKFIPGGFLSYVVDD